MTTLRRPRMETLSSSGTLRSTCFRPYGTQLNERGLFTSTLPSYTLSRRPSATRDSWNDPSPAGILTFSGPPGERHRCACWSLTAGDSSLTGRRGGCVPNVCSGRALDLSTHPPKELAKIAAGHWLLPLRSTDRLYAAPAPMHNDRYLLYDAELPFAPHVTLEREESGYRVTNSGKFPVHDVVVYRPTGDGDWELAMAALVEAATQQSDDADKEEAGDSSPQGENDAENPAAGVFDAAGRSRRRGRGRHPGRTRRGSGSAGSCRRPAGSGRTRRSRLKRPRRLLAPPPQPH